MTGHSHLMNGERKLFIIKRLLPRQGLKRISLRTMISQEGQVCLSQKKIMDFTAYQHLQRSFFCERGLPFLYQGQEIGMSNCQWKYDEFNDLETINQYQIALKAGMSKEQALEIARHHSRDNARTPNANGVRKEKCRIFQKRKNRWNDPV